MGKTSVERVREWRANNPERYRELNVKNHKEFREKFGDEDKIRLVLFNKLETAVRRLHNYPERLTGEQTALLRHFKKQFTKDMDWSNWKTFWVVDHRIPLKYGRDISFISFEQKEAFFNHFDNIRPLEIKKNCKKASRLPKNADKIISLLYEEIMLKDE